VEFGEDAGCNGTHKRSDDVDPAIATIIILLPDSLIISTDWFVAIIVASPHQELNCVPWIDTACKEVPIYRNRCNVAYMYKHWFDKTTPTSYTGSHIVVSKDEP